MEVIVGKCNSDLNLIATYDRYSYGKEQAYNTKSDEAKAKIQSAC